MNNQDNSVSRYARQKRLSIIGEAGQQAIRACRVILVGCGALGTVIADLLVRAGIGSISVVDRDIVEKHNLQRQTLFDEADAAEALPKSEAALRKLRQINSEVEIAAHTVDFNPVTARRLARDADLIMDGTDNFETRQLINDLTLELGIPWVYGGAIGTEGMVKAVIPGKTSCFRCLMADVPPPGSTPTCETAGILASTSVTVAALQVSQGLRIITGHEIHGDLHLVNVWQPEVRRLSAPRLDDCPACVKGDSRFLQGAHSGTAAELCGSNAVQVQPLQKGTIDLGRLEQMLNSIGPTRNRRFYLQFQDGNLQLSIFPDGRTIVKGTDDPARARAAVARVLGG